MPIQTYNDARDDVNKIDKDLSQGHVSIQEASQAVTHINDGWDKLAKNSNGLKKVFQQTLEEQMVM